MKWGRPGPSSSLFPEVTKILGHLTRMHLLVLQRPQQFLTAPMQATEANIITTDAHLVADALNYS